jgi:hypothetical protein
VKIRNDFVTNSSSSSFVIIGKKVNGYNEIDLSKSKYVVIGDFLSDGYDIFDVDKNILEALPYLRYEDMAIIEVYQEIYGDDIFNEVVNPYTEGVRLWSGERDYHGSYGKQDVEERYGWDEN